MADGTSEGTAAADTESSSFESLRLDDQDTVTEVKLLAIYWFLYNDDSAPKVLNQSWPTVWRVFGRLIGTDPETIDGAAMRRRLLDAGFTVKPKGVVGHAGLTQSAIDRLTQVGLLSNESGQVSLSVLERFAIRKAAKIVARNIIRKSTVFQPDQSGTLKEIIDGGAIPHPAGQALDTAPDRLIDGKKEQRRPHAEFGEVLDRDTLIGYLKAAQTNLGLKTQQEFATFLGVSDAMVRKAYAGKATIDTLSEYLGRCGISVQTRMIAQTPSLENVEILTKG
jgi:hypothetical protein